MEMITEEAPVLGVLAVRKHLQGRLESKLARPCLQALCERKDVREKRNLLNCGRRMDRQFCSPGCEWNPDQRAKARQACTHR